MTALAKSKDRIYKEGKLLSVPVVASDIIYKGALVKINAAGFLAPCAAELGAKFAGVAYEECDNSSGSAGDENCRVERTGRHLMEGTGFAQSDVGSKVYASDDDTVSTTQAENEQEVGEIAEFVSSTQVYVNITKTLEGTLPSHVLKFAGEFATAGGDANEVITLSGLLATDIVLVNLHTKGSTPRTILTAVAAAGQIDVVLSGDPSTDHVLSYAAYRVI